jgi:hypothetical protein
MSSAVKTFRPGETNISCPSLFIHQKHSLQSVASRDGEMNSLGKDPFPQLCALSVVSLISFSKSTFYGKFPTNIKSEVMV